MVHHYPGYDPTHYDHEILDRTRASIRAAGFDVDEELWAAPGDERLVGVAAWKRAQRPDSRDPQEPRPVRGFIMTRPRR